MSAFIIRTAVAAVIAISFAVQARRAPARSSRQIAFGLGAAAFAVFTLSNGLAMTAVSAPIVQGISIAGIIMIALSLVMMVRSYTSGEMGEKLRRAREMVAEERARTKERR